MLTIAPPPAALSSGTARRAHRNWPVRSTSRQRRQSAGSISSIGRGRPGDAGIVDQHVEPAQGAAELGEQAVDLRLVGDVGHGWRQARVRRAAMLGQRRLVDVAQVHPRAGRDQRLDDGAPDARGTGGHQHPLPVRPELCHPSCLPSCP